jgi:DNA-binding CsgD family transcriptional regulator
MTHSIPNVAQADDTLIGNPSVERARAVNEVGAAIAHELSGPLTALLLYVADLHQNRDRFPIAEGDGQSLKLVAENALRATERVCRLMRRIAGGFEAPLQKETAIAHGREVIRWWSHAGEGREDVRQPPRAPQELLTPREREVLRLVIEGCTNKQGAMRMQISYRTFEGHRAEVMRKFGAKNAIDLIKLALVTPVASCDTLLADISPIAAVQAQHETAQLISSEITR